VTLGRWALAEKIWRTHAKPQLAAESYDKSMICLKKCLDLIYIYLVWVEISKNCLCDLYSHFQTEFYMSGDIQKLNVFFLQSFQDRFTRRPWFLLVVSVPRPEIVINPSLGIQSLPWWDSHDGMGDKKAPKKTTFWSRFDHDTCMKKHKHADLSSLRSNRGIYSWMDGAGDG
jgi:hypothetical protein